jgi:crotonobetainyl-CoA:carnitine CoA-transferase CaiB-like acyl-CoA transferase
MRRIDYTLTGRATDSFIMIGAGNDKQFKILAGVLSQPSWASDARFKDNTRRVANREELIGLIKDTLSRHTTAEWVERFTGQGVPFAPINNIQVWRGDSADPMIVQLTLAGTGHV